MNKPKYRLPPPRYTVDDNKPLHTAFAFLLFSAGLIAGVWTLFAGAMEIIK